MGLPSSVAYRDAQRKQIAASIHKTMISTSYQQNFAVLFGLSKILMLGFLVGSAVSSHQYFRGLLGYKIPAGDWLLYSTICLQVVYEGVKFGLGSIFLKNWYSLIPMRLPLLGLLFVVVSGYSMYASIMGGGQLARNSGKIKAITSTHNAEIDQINKEITSINRRHTWKGNTYIAEGTPDKKLLLAKEALLATARQNKNTAIAENSATERAHVQTYRWWFAAFELFFVLCLLYSYIYRKRVAWEYARTIEGAEDAPSLDTSTVGATATCKHPNCEVTFKRKTLTHLFCCAQHKNDFNNNHR